MTVDIEIVIDPAPSGAGINAIEGLLTGLEVKGKAVGEALTKAIGDGVSGGATDGTSLSNYLKDLERQASIFDGIHAPAQTYHADLSALDTLLSQGAINVGEYAESVTRLNRALGDGSKAGAASIVPTEAQRAALAATNKELLSEAQILERLRGPQSAYSDGLRTADRLLDAGKISTEEYARAVAQLNRAYESAVPNIETFNRKQADTAKALSTISLPGTPQAVGGGGSKLMELIGSVSPVPLAPVAAAAWGINELKAQYEEWKRNEDVIIRAENAVRKFTTSQRELNALMVDQKQLSKDLRLGLEQTAGIYAATRDAAGDLFLTQQQLIDLTRNVTQAMILQGKSTESAAELMARLEYAQKKGSIAGVEFQGILKSNSDIAQIWVEGTGKSIKELVKSAQDGSLNIRQLIVLLAEADKIGESFAKRRLTSDELALVRENRIKTNKEIAVSGGAGGADKIRAELALASDYGFLPPGLAGLIGPKKAGPTQFDAMVENFMRAHQEGLLLADAIDRNGTAMAEFLRLLAKLAAEGPDKALRDVKNIAAEAAAEMQNLAAAFEMAAKAGEDPMVLERLGRQLMRSQIKNDLVGKTYGDTIAPVVNRRLDRKIGRQDLKDALAANDITRSEYAEQMRALQGPESEYEQWLKRINAPQKDFEKGSRFIAQALKDQAITTKQASDEMDRLLRSIGGGGILDALKGAATPKAAADGSQVEVIRDQIRALKAEVAGNTWLENLLMGRGAQNDDLYQKLGAAEVAKRHGDQVQAATDTEALIELERQLAGEVGEQTNEYRKLHDLYDRGIVTLDQYNARLLQLGELYKGDALDPSVFGQKFEALIDQMNEIDQQFGTGTKSKEQMVLDSYHKMREEAQRTAEVTGQAIGEGVGVLFDTMNKAAQGSITTWRQFFREVLSGLRDIASQMARQAITSAVASAVGNAIGSAGGGAGSGMTTSGGAGDWADHLKRTAPSGGGGGGVTVSFDEGPILETLSSTKAQRIMLSNFNRGRGAFQPMLGRKSS